MTTNFSPRIGVKESYGFNDWPRVSALQNSLHRSFHGGVALDGFERKQRYPVPDQRNTYIDVYQSLGNPDVGLNVWIAEYGDASQAREGLIDQLMTSMATNLPRLSALGIEAGEVGFAGHGELRTEVEFVRGHVLVKVLSSGKQAIAVDRLARVIDLQVQQSLQ